MQIDNHNQNTFFDSSWNFENSNTKTYTHCFHKYPAMMIPQIASRLLNKYAKNANYLFDPYCGTGTSLVEGLLNNINSYGTDLNPLARLIAKAKTTCLDIKKLNFYIQKYIEFINDFKLGKTIKTNKPNFNNLEYWFSDNVIDNLALIKYFIDEITNYGIKNFFKVAFSETVRESSYTRNGEFKLYRMPKEKLLKFYPDVFKLMNSKIDKNLKGLTDFIKHKKGYASSYIFDFDTVKIIPDDFRKKFDIILTSPPYGDSRTTVAYGQFSRLANQWLGISNASKVDKELMGGKKKGKFVNFKIPVLDDILYQISLIDEKRSSEVNSFYQDYQKSINHVSQTVKSGGYIIYVVGNRCVKNIRLPNDIITKTLLEVNDLKHVETIIRNIPNKRMPIKNSPTNVKGVKSETMTHEFIVVMKK